jgi:hypothetical protein
MNLVRSIFINQINHGLKIMQRFMKVLVLEGLLVLAAVLCITSFAQASQSHHSHHQAKIVSPFDKASENKPLHCLLNFHLDKAGQECPHKANHSEKTMATGLRADCGSNPVNSDGISFGNDLPQYTQNDEFAHHLVLLPLIPTRIERARLFPHSIERPPQLS